MLASGLVEYRPAANYFGPDSVGYRVCDDGTTAGAPDPKCADATILFTVTPVNDPPVAVDDTATTDGVSRSTAALANDTDVDGDTLTVASSPSRPRAGNRDPGRSARLRYTPAAGFTGVATFGYVVADGNGGSDTGAVSVTVTPRLEILDASVTEGNSGLVDLVFTVRLTGPSTTAGLGDVDDGEQDGGGRRGLRGDVGTVTIPAGTLSVTVPVRVFGDLLDEPDETFAATLSGPSGATIGDGTATGTIVDDGDRLALRQRRQHRRGQPRDDRDGVQGRAQLGEREDGLRRVCDGGHRRHRRRRLPDGRGHPHLRSGRDAQIGRRPGDRRHRSSRRRRCR